MNDQQQTLNAERLRLRELEQENAELRRRLQIADELLELQGKKLMPKRKHKLTFYKDN